MSQQINLTVDDCGRVQYDGGNYHLLDGETLTVPFHAHNHVVLSRIDPLRAPDPLEAAENVLVNLQHLPKVPKAVTAWINRTVERLTPSYEDY